MKHSKSVYLKPMPLKAGSLKPRRATKALLTKTAPLNMLGASMIEVLVALFVLAIGLLGVIALQTESLKLNNQAYSSTQALFLANEMAERIRIDTATFLTDPNGAAGAVAQPTGAGNVEVDSWKEDVAARLPGGLGEITPRGINLYEIKISYNQQKLNNEDLADTQDDVKIIDYVLTVRI